MIDDYTMIEINPLTRRVIGRPGTFLLKCVHLIELSNGLAASPGDDQLQQVWTDSICALSHFNQTPATRVGRDAGTASASPGTALRRSGRADPRESRRAGYGKTTLLSTWLDTCALPSAWLSRRMLRTVI